MAEAGPVPVTRYDTAIFQPVSPPQNRFDLPEWSGAFGDLGTLIPFVVAYLSVLKMDASGLFVAFGLRYRRRADLTGRRFPCNP